MVTIIKLIIKPVLLKLYISLLKILYLTFILYISVNYSLITFGSSYLAL